MRISRGRRSFRLNRARVCEPVPARYRYRDRGVSGRSLELLTRFCSVFEILPLTRTGAEIAGRARAHLETAGQRIGPHDVLIAGIALAEARVLVTHNTCEFRRVPDLKFEDWLV